jgi:hypothetical protein
MLRRQVGSPCKHGTSIQNPPRYCRTAEQCKCSAHVMLCHNFPRLSRRKDVSVLRAFTNGLGLDNVYKKHLPFPLTGRLAAGYASSRVFFNGVVLSTRSEAQYSHGMKKCLRSIYHNCLSRQELPVDREIYMISCVSLGGAGSGSIARCEAVLPFWSLKRGDHRDQEAKSITTGSMCLQEPTNSGSGRGLRGQARKAAGICGTVTVQGSAFHPKCPSFPRSFQVFAPELCIAIALSLVQL